MTPATSPTPEDPPATLASKAWILIRCSVEAWFEDDAPSMGAALVYYTILSMAPLFVIVVAMVGVIFGADAAKAELVSQTHTFIGAAGESVVRSILSATRAPRTSLIASAIGVLTMMIGATSIFNELQNDFDRIWRARARGQSRTVWGLVRSRLVSFQMILIAGFLLLSSVILSAMLSALSARWKPVLGEWSPAFQRLDILASIAAMTLLFALMFKLLPRVKVAWSDVGIGALVTAVLFAAGKSAIAVYLGRSAFSSAFGAAGSIVVLIVWVYYSAQIFLFGAEFTCVYAHCHGSHCGNPDGRWPPNCTDFKREQSSRRGLWRSRHDVLHGSAHMANAKSFQDLFLDEIRDLYDAEKQLTKALPKMAAGSTSSDLRAALESHLEETRGHVERLEQVFDLLDEKPRAKHCAGIAGIIEEGGELLKGDVEDAARDAGIIVSGQRAEHYEIAAYGSVIAWATTLGNDDIVTLLTKTLNEEKAADQKLSELATGGINEEAANSTQTASGEGTMPTMKPGMRSSTSAHRH